MARLDGRVAVVTGSSTGIGQGIAQRFAAEGASVVVNYIGSADGANQTLTSIQTAGGKGVVCQADVSVSDDRRKLIDCAYENFGCCDILVNNAGIEKKAAFWEVAEADYDKLMGVNLKGPFFLTQYFVQKLLAANKPGRVINISSVHEDMVFPGFAPYCTSKGGIRMLMRTLAAELGPKQIAVNNIAPGAIATPINKDLLNDKTRLDALTGTIPLRRMGTPEDVAAVALFLASYDAAYVTGSTYFVDGGLMRSYRE